jgi:endonuclease/exonuclease/phosphatase family metal-dependent hydrolase
MLAGKIFLKYKDVYTIGTESLKLLNWNIKAFFRTNLNFKNKINYVYEIIKANQVSNNKNESSDIDIDIDIINLVEVNGIYDNEYIIKYFHDIEQPNRPILKHIYFEKTLDIQQKDTLHGNMLFLNNSFDIISIKFLYLPTYIKKNYAICFFKLKRNDKIINLFSIHLQAKIINIDQRTFTIFFIFKYIISNKLNLKNTILMGDFNENSMNDYISGNIDFIDIREYLKQDSEKQKKIIKKIIKKTTYGMNTGNDIPVQDFTYDNVDNIINYSNSNDRLFNNQNKLDYILLSRNFYITEVKNIILESFNLTKKNNMNDISDHYPLYYEIKYKENYEIKYKEKYENKKINEIINPKLKAEFYISNDFFEDYYVSYNYININYRSNLKIISFDNPIKDFVIICFFNDFDEYTICTLITKEILEYQKDKINHIIESILLYNNLSHTLNFTNLNNKNYIITFKKRFV